MKTDRTFLAEFSVAMTIEKMTFLVKVIHIRAKFYIHKSKYMKVKPQCCTFHHEFHPYTKALRVMGKKKKTSSLSCFLYILVIFNVTAFLCLFIYSMFIF